MSDVLVLGGTGFVGSHVLHRLQRDGIPAAAASRRTGVDLRSADATRRLLRQTRPAAIVNCAAHVGSVHYVTQFAAEVLHDNLQMILSLYEAARDVCPGVHIIQPIANCAYPGIADVYREPEWMDGPVHPSVLSYGATRRMAVVAAMCYAKQHGIRTSNLFVPNVYGPGDHTDPNKTHALNGLIIRILAAKREGAPQFEIWGTGKPIREWLYVEDLADVLAQSLGMDRDLIEPVNIAQNSGSTIRQLAEMIARSLGYAGELTFNASYQDGAPTKIMDDARFRELFPDFRFTPMEEGIRRTVAYYESVV
ncbi:NAD-dependent epimerase/dehydratase family protein [Candidatus Poribacteria bacterium]|nr:NAD-dependent epimerase/dehydratase family protein [Candidatus Poribacteria bacterium]